MKSPLSSILMISCLTINATSSFALNINSVLGEKRATFTSPSGKSELCVVANKKNPKFYDEDDLKDEAELCGYNFYKDVAMCPKQTSTNPGISIAKILDGKSREQTMAMCLSNSNSVSVKAKFKQSITCSYTPSILAYYHFSRILKAGRIPVSVLRTMDKAEHLKMAQLGYASAGANSTTKKTWNQFLAAHTAGTSTKIFDDSKQYVYGALSVNPKKEEKYTELNIFPSYDQRYQAFISRPPYQRLANSASVAQIAGSNDPKVVVPLMVQMKDMSDMILMDTLFSQDDRIGNIHYKAAIYSIKTTTETDGKIKSEYKSDKATSVYDNANKKWIVSKEDALILAKDKTAFLVREMILKDNDCGVDKTVRSNNMRKISAIEGIRHMSPRTYKRFMNFYKVAKDEETIKWMKNELQFTSADIGDANTYASYISNLERARKVLLENCKNGSLKLDLDVDSVIAGNTLEPVSCEQ